MYDKQSGFSLIECMIYSTVLAIFITIFFNGITHWIAQLTKQGISTHILYELYAAHDLLIRDLRQAPTDRFEWKKITEEQVVWRGRDIDIGWYVHQGNLYRSSGSFNQSTDQWITHTKSLVARSVSDCKFSAHYTDHGLQYITVTLTIERDDIHKKHILETDVVVAQGILYEEA
jgi:hypothetical protein